MKHFRQTRYRLGDSTGNKLRIRSGDILRYVSGWNQIFQESLRIKKYLFILLPILYFSCNGGEEITYTGIEGLFSCDENSAELGYRKYIVEIQDVPSQENTYILANFHNLGDNEFLYIEHIGDSIFINNQIILQYFVDGKGRVSEDFREITLSYTADDGTRELEYYVMLSR